MPTIVKPSNAAGHAPEAVYHVASVPLDAALAGAPVAIVLDVERLRAMSGSSNISAVALSLLRRLEDVIQQERLP